MNHDFSFLDRMADQQAARVFDKQREAKRLESEKEMLRIQAEQLRLELKQKKLEGERRNFANEVNCDAILAIESGDLNAIKAIYEILHEDEREAFLFCEPLESSLIYNQFEIAEYLVDKGLTCESWRDYDKNMPESLLGKFKQVSMPLTPRPRL